MVKETLYCTECSKTLRFNRKPEKSGRLIIVCDGCGHKHYRIVVNGAVMEDRWDSSEEPVSTKFGVERNSK